MNKGLRQGDPLSPALLTLDMAIRNIKTKPGSGMYHRLTQYMAYADFITRRSVGALSGELEEFVSRT